MLVGKVFRRLLVKTAPWIGPRCRDKERVVNDIQSQLNETHVARIVRPRSIEEIQTAIRAAAREGQAVCVSGGRHAQGGQQFGTDAVLLDLAAFNKVLRVDLNEKFVDVQAGIEWPDLIKELHRAQRGAAQQWSIRQNRRASISSRSPVRSRQTPMDAACASSRS